MIVTSTWRPPASGNKMIGILIISKLRFFGQQLLSAFVLSFHLPFNSIRDVVFLSLRDLTKRFGSVVAVNHANLDVNEGPVGKRNVQMIFQNYALWPHMKVFDERSYTNLTLPLKIKKWSKERIGEFLRPLAQRIGIDESFFQRKPSELSGGQQQRVA